MGLFNSTILDVIIGLVFVYLLLSILCTAANEWVAAITRRRGEMLREGIHQLLENKPTIAFDDLEAGGKDLPDGQVKRSVLALIQRSNRQLELAQASIEGWFNDAMDRVSGWYKRRTQIWTLVIALALTLVANADTIHIARQLWTDPVLRAAVVEEAKVRAQKPRPTISVEYKDEDDPTNPTVTRNEGNQLSDKERDLLGQLLGWHDPIKDSLRPQVFLGWLLTVLALSLGAPFWFDLLNKFMNVRFAGKSPDESSKKPEKQDSQPRA